MKKISFRTKVFLVFLGLMTLLSPGQLSAQEEMDTSGYLPNVLIDSVIIIGRKLDVPNFIKYVKTDTSFYKAFKNMRVKTFNATNDIKVYDKKRNIIASLESETKQIYRNGCRTMNVLEENITGDFYKEDGDYRYYTAEMYAHLFFTKGKICDQNTRVREKDLSPSGKKGIEKRATQLKQLIFAPGSRVDDIPFFGKKSSIFTDNMADKYEYTITEEDRNGFTCYKFEALPLPQYKKSVVINKLTTWFRKDDFSIVARHYNMSFNGMGYDFDVDMMVHLTEINGTLLPSYIAYNGDWSVTTQGREHVQFIAHFYY